MLIALFWLVVVAATVFILARQRVSMLAFTVGAAAVLLLAYFNGFLANSAAIILGGLFVIVAAIFNIRSIRHKVVSTPLLKYVRAVLPPMSDTEREAIDAGIH